MEKHLPDLIRAVKREGNALARETILRVFEIGARKWRGIGAIPESGYRLKPAFARFDAEAKFSVGEIQTNEHPACIAGAILTGEKTPLATKTATSAYIAMIIADSSARAARSPMITGKAHIEEEMTGAPLWRLVLGAAVISAFVWAVSKGFYIF